MVLISSASLSCAGLRGRAGANVGGAASGGSVPSPRDGGHPAHEVAAAPFGSLTIRKWRLDNGLEIITIPDPGARNVSYLTVVRVGSRDENAAAGETGLAHLFEHLMFTGTRVGDKSATFDQQIEEVGGSSNAATTTDFTSYINEIPPEALDKVTRLEADRLINLDLGPKQVANERDVVVQERLGAVDDSVDGTLDEMLWQQSFRTHPYRWPIIGRMADIKAVTREKALTFYRRHYAPDRALIVVAGRFDESAALSSIGSAYGGQTPAAQPLPPAPVAERAPAVEVRARVERPVPADRFVIGYPAPALGDLDRAAYDVLNGILTGGPSARLVRLLVVDQEIASSVTGDVADTRDPGLWCLWVQMTKGNDARRAEDLIAREVARLAREPVAALELSAAKNRLETNFWQLLASSRGRAEAFGQFDVTTGDFRHLMERSAAYARVTAEDVVRVARLFLEPGVRSVVIASPGARP